MRERTFPPRFLLIGLCLAVAPVARAEPTPTELDQELERVAKRPAPAEATPAQPGDPVIPIVGHRHQVERVTPAWVIALGLGALVFVVAGAGSLLLLRSSTGEPEPDPKAPPGETIG